MRFILKHILILHFRPAGGSEQWTATACDWVSRYLTGAVATIIIQVCNQNVCNGICPRLGKREGI